MDKKYNELSITEVIIAMVAGIILQYLAYIIVVNRLAIGLTDYIRIIIPAMIICSLIGYLITIKLLISTYSVIFFLFFLNINLFIPMQLIFSKQQPEVAGILIILVSIFTFIFLLAGELGRRKVENRKSNPEFLKDHLKGKDFFATVYNGNKIVRDTSKTSWLVVVISGSWIVTLFSLMFGVGWKS